MTVGLDVHREHLDELDAKLLQLLGERFAICRDVALYKHARGLAMMQPARVHEVRQRYLAGGRERGLPPDFSAALFELLIEATCRLEDELMASAAAERHRA